MPDDQRPQRQDDPSAALAALREREAATREILEVISRSRDDEKPVFDAILANAARLCDAPMARLHVANEARTHFALAAAWGEALRTFRVGEQFPLDSPLGVSTAIREARTIHIEDLAEDPLYRQRHPLRVKLVDEEGIRTYLTVPLVSGGAAFGSISLSRREVKPFSARDIALVQTFAAQAVIAIENVRQFRELQTRLERESATREILQVISHSRDDEKPVFDAILANAARLCDAPMASLNLLDEKGKRLILRAHWGTALVHYEVGVTEWPLDGSAIPAQAVRENRHVQIEDFAATDLYKDGDPLRVRAVEKEGIRTFLAVPLLRSGEAIGCIALFRREVRPFDARHIALIETFAAQAVIAIENVRQFHELQTRLEREAATREILQVISRSRDDVNPVLETIVRNAARLCDSPDVGLHLANEARTKSRLVCVSNADQGIFAIGQEFDLSLPHQTPTTIREGRVIHNPDIADDPLYRARDPIRVRLVEVDGVRSRLSVPLLKDGVAFGCINLNRHEVRPFTGAEIALIETFAAQAVIAIENVRQFRELQTRLEREAATREILQVISHSRDDEKPVFDAIIENASRLCKAPLAFLSMANEERTHATVPAHRGARSGFAAVLDAFRLPIAGSKLVAIRPITECQVIRIDDIAETEMYRERDPYRVAMVEDEGIRSLLAVPLIGGGQGIGAIVLYRREVAPFSDDDVALAESFAAQAVIAVENVKQFRALQARTEEVQALNANLETRVAEQVDELERLGRLKRFLSPQVAEAVVSSGSDKLLSSHRALIATLFCDIRGFTAFCETAEPEETIEVLQTYHEEMGRLINARAAGVDHRMGDGIMVLFNDPLPCEDPAGAAVRLALDMRARMAELCAGWKRLGHRLGFGVGISLGYATVGMVGSEGRYEYTASGTAVNLAARLCDKAEDGDILLSPRACMAVQDAFRTQSGGDLSLKGIHTPIEVFRVLGRLDA